MSRVSPLTARVTLAISDARRRALLAFMADGELTAIERDALAAIDDAGRMTELNDLARRVGLWVQETGNIDELATVTELSPFLARQVRELDAA